MRTAWKAIPTLSVCARIAAGGLECCPRFPYGAGIQQELDERKSLTDGRRGPGSGDDASFELRPGVFGYRALRVAHLVSEATLTRTARSAEEKVRLGFEACDIPWCHAAILATITSPWSRCATKSLMVAGRPVRWRCRSPLQSLGAAALKARDAYGEANSAKWGGG